MANEFVQDDTGSKLEVTCKNDADKSVIDLTGSTVKARWKDKAGAVVEKNMTITDAAGGVAEYQFAAGELEAGTTGYEIEITDAQSSVIKNLNLLLVNIREKIS